MIGMEREKARIEWGTVLTVLCTMAGTGILQLPLSIAQGGWVCLAVILGVALLTNRTGLWLIECLYYAGKDGQEGLLTTASDKAVRLKDYPTIGERAYGRGGRIVSQIFHKATLFGVTTLFLILAAKFLQEGFGNDGFQIAALNALDNRAYTLIAGGIVLIPVLLIPTLKEVSFLAGFGLAASMVSVLEVVLFAFVIPELTSETVAEYHLPVPPTFHNVTQHDIVE